MSAIRAGRARELQLWYGGRAIDRAGRGMIPISAIGVHLSRTSRWRALHRGEGVFWTLGGRKVFLFGVARVARALEVRHVTACRAPGAWLHERSWRMICAQAFLGGIAAVRNGRPVAVSTMAQLAGVSERTIRTWQQRAQWGRIINVALLVRIAEASNGRHVSRRSLDGRVIRVELDDGGVWLAARLPNSLEIRRWRVREWAALRRVNARLTSDHGDPGQRPQRYVIFGQRRPRFPPKETIYQLHSQLTVPEQIQVWLPLRSPEIRVQFLKRFGQSSSAEDPGGRKSSTKASGACPRLPRRPRWADGHF